MTSKKPDRFKDPKVIQEVIHCYKTGMLVTDMMKHFRTNHPRLKALLLENGITLRPRGWGPPRVKPAPCDAALTYRLDSDGTRINCGKTYAELLMIAAKRGNRAAAYHLAPRSEID